MIEVFPIERFYSKLADISGTGTSTKCCDFEKKPEHTDRIDPRKSILKKEIYLDILSSKLSYKILLHNRESENKFKTIIKQIV